ncbi:hypothetical protein MKW98_026579, partial [Papaver atlanticum]
LNIGAVDTCYLLDFVGPKGFYVELSKVFNRVIVFNHSKLAKVPSNEECPDNLKLNINRFLWRMLGIRTYGNANLSNEIGKELSLRSAAAGLRPIGAVIYMQPKKSQDVPEEKGASELHYYFVYDQLLELDPDGLITRGNAYIFSRQNAANKLVDKPFKIHLDRGFL